MTGCYGVVTPAVSCDSSIFFLVDCGNNCKSEFVSYRKSTSYTALTADVVGQQKAGSRDALLCTWVWLHVAGWPALLQL